MTTEALAPLFKPSSQGGRIINVASGAGHLSRFEEETRQEVERFTSLSEIEAFVDRFLKDVEDGRWEEKGWPKTFHSYTVSKVLLSE